MTPVHRSWVRVTIVAVAIVAAFALGLSLSPGSDRSNTSMTSEASDTAAETWTCSMHPQIQMPGPGQCPICGMDLIPLAAEGGSDANPRSLTLSPAARKIAEIQTTPVVRRPVEKTLRMVGKLEPDETRVREIAAWVSGRVDRLYVDYTGVTVHAGEKLFDLYSPDLYAAQQELLQAVAASRELSRSDLESTRRSATRTAEAARERLRLWGLTGHQIQAIEQRGEPSDHVTIVAPTGGVVLHKNATEGTYVQTGTKVYTIADLSVLWLQLNVYESDLAWLETGQRVEFGTDAYPGTTFEGTVSFIDPLLDERTRSVEVRVDVPNPDARLKPGMFARAVVRASVGADTDEPPLVIPSSAPLVTGTRAVVYVEDPDEPGRYEGREVMLGPEADGFYVVLDGLEVGDAVVANGSFKIDSALQILAKQSMMSPEGGVRAPGHEHGETPPSTMESMDPPAEPIANVPDEFRRQLDDVVADYLALTTALSRDDFDGARSAAGALPTALHAVDDGALPSAGRAPWSRTASILEAESRSIASASDIETARRIFHALSAEMIHTVRLFGASGRTPVYVYHCPMAMDGSGGDWLQTTEGTENPYYGSMMFRCGSQTETLVAGSDPDATGEPEAGDSR